MRDSYQLHAAVVEVILHKDAEVKYSTVQNWFSGGESKGGILNFVTARCAKVPARKCPGPSLKPARPSPKYPSVILQGDNSIGEFFSVALTSGHQQADTGTKMIHIGKTPSRPSSPKVFRRPQREHLSRLGENPAGGGKRP